MYNLCPTGPIDGRIKKLQYPPFNSHTIVYPVSKFFSQGFGQTKTFSFISKSLSFISKYSTADPVNQPPR